MLVVSRKAEEKILIGDDVVITIVRIGPNTVRIGIEAPKAINIARAEIVRSIDIAMPECSSIDIDQLAALTGLGG